MGSFPAARIYLLAGVLHVVSVLSCPGASATVTPYAQTLVLSQQNRVLILAELLLCTSS